MGGTDMQDNAFVVSKARCNKAKILSKRRKTTIDLSKAYSVTTCIPRGNSVARVAAEISTLTMLGAYKNAPLNSGYFGYNIRLVVVWWWWWYIKNVHTPNSPFTVVHSSSKDRCRVLHLPCFIFPLRCHDAAQKT
jgi:hypothetical protein